MTDYKHLLEHSYKKTQEVMGADCDRLVYLAEHIFDFTTYDDEMSELFAERAIEVCEAITESKTFDYIERREDHMWYLIMCNMPFFYDKLDWARPSGVLGGYSRNCLSFRV